MICFMDMSNTEQNLCGLMCIITFNRLIMFGCKGVTILVAPKVSGELTLYFLLTGHIYILPNVYFWAGVTIKLYRLAYHIYILAPTKHNHIKI